MDYKALADLLFPNVTDTPEMLEEKFPMRNSPEGAVIICEFADPDYVVMMLTPETDISGIERLKNLLLKISKKSPVTKAPPVPVLKKAKMSLREALFALQTTIKTEDCLGRISASVDAACPPAIPIVLPGEVIDQNVIDGFNYYGIKEWSVVK